MSETPSFSPANSARRPSGCRQGPLASSSGMPMRFTTLPVSTETRNRLRRLPVRPKNAIRSPRGSNATERPIRVAVKLTIRSSYSPA
jgi:hypothetical protein